MALDDREQFERELNRPHTMAGDMDEFLAAWANFKMVLFAHVTKPIERLLARWNRDPFGRPKEPK